MRRELNWSRLPLWCTRSRTTLAVLSVTTAATACCTVEVVAASPSDSPASAIGNEAVYGIAVAPDYTQTGLVAVMSMPLRQCQSGCQHLWVSHDGGATWARTAAKDWDGGRPMIAVDKSGHDVMFTATSALERSDDGGQTWTVAGDLGFSALSPNFSKDQTIAVGGTGSKQDFIWHAGSTKPIAGSSGAFWDQYFMLSPTWPSGGKYSPALLAAADSHTQYPVIQHCDANLSCSGATSLSGSQPFSAPASLLPSTDYANDGAVFAQTGRGIYKSTDGGLTFTLIPMGQPGATTTATPMMVLAPGYSEAGPVRTAYVAVFQAFVDGKTSHTAGGIYRTTDGGRSWAPLGAPGPFDQGAFGVGVAPDGRLFGGFMNNGHAGLLCSADGGTTWKASCPAVGGPTTSRASGGSSAGNCAGASCAQGAQIGPSSAALSPATSAPTPPDANTTAHLPSTAAAAAQGTAAHTIRLLAVVLGSLAGGLVLVGVLRNRLRRRDSESS